MVFTDSTGADSVIPFNSLDNIKLQSILPYYVQTNPVTWSNCFEIGKYYVYTMQKNSGSTPINITSLVGGELISVLPYQCGYGGCCFVFKATDTSITITMSGRDAHTYGICASLN